MCLTECCAPALAHAEHIIGAPVAGDVCDDKEKVIILCWSLGQRERPVQPEGP